MIERKKRLRWGFTTGTAAAAAAMGAMIVLFEKRIPDLVNVKLLNGETIDIKIESTGIYTETTAFATVRKDAGDDPDVTNGAIIGARVEVTKNDNGRSVRITGGEGVGLITRPGLELPPGEYAINSGPRKMIRESVLEILEKAGISCSVNVEIYVPDGKKISKQTLNARLGIIGGISILGTTGLVKPLSHEAYTATIKALLSVSRASGITKIVLTTGRRSEKHAENYLLDFHFDSFIQIGDYFRFAVETASEMGFSNIVIAVFFGKAVKMAQGFPHTHASKSELSLNMLSNWCLEITSDGNLAEEISNANTARHAFSLIHGKYPDVIDHIGNLIMKNIRGFGVLHPIIRSIIFDYDGTVVFDSDQIGGNRQ